MRKRLWLDIPYALAYVLAVGSISMAVYAAGDRDPGYDPPVVEDIRHEPEATGIPQEPMASPDPSAGPEPTETEGIKMWPAFSYGREWGDEDIYLLARAAMAEAEGSTVQCKSLVVMSILNRVADNGFPDTIQEVIFQCDERTGVYQYSCIGNGRWDRVEPDRSCFEAVELVREAEYDYSGGALYFESCKEEDNWHSQHLDYLYQCGELRFYR